MLILKPLIVTIFFNTFYQPSKSLLLGMKCVIDRQDFLIQRFKGYTATVLGLTSIHKVKKMYDFF